VGRFREALSLGTFNKDILVAEGILQGGRFREALSLCILLGHFRLVGHIIWRTFLLMHRVGAFVVYRAIYVVKLSVRHLIAAS
jgi:hypothetical protein